MWLATGVKRKVSLCDTPSRALYSSYNPNPNTQQKQNKF